MLRHSFTFLRTVQPKEYTDSDPEIKSHKPNVLENGSTMEAETLKMTKTHMQFTPNIFLGLKLFSYCFFNYRRFGSVTFAIFWLVVFLFHAFALVVWVVAQIRFDV